jgi:hypothetical protein
MAQAILRQQPAAVLRSHVNHLRAALAVATVALIGLTAAVAILATEDDVDTRGSSENPLTALTPKERHRVEALSSLSWGRLAAAFGRGAVSAPLPGTPYHGDPGILGPPPHTPYDGDPGILGPPPHTPFDGDPGILRPPPGAGSAAEVKDEAGTAAAVGQSSGVTKFRGSKASEHGTSAGQPGPGARP